jgi:hypothetical protein
MTKKSWKNEHTYAEFDRVIQLFEKWIAGQTFVFNGFQKETVEARIVQRFVQLLFYPFCFRVVQKIKEGNHPFPADGEKIALDGITIDTATGKILPGIKKTAGMFLDFLWQWALALKAIIIGYVAGKKWEGPSTLLFGISKSDITLLGTEKPFVEFCKKGPVIPLVNAQRLVIQSNAKSESENAFIQYTSYPVYETIKRAKLGFTRRTGLLLRHFLLPFRFSWAVMRKRVMVVLAKDSVQAQLVSCLDRANLIQSVIITNSDFFVQYLWMRQPASRSFKVHEVHYSQNTKPMVFKEEPFSANFPAFRHVTVDEHWVWTEGYKNYIEELGHTGPVHVVGPILWYLPGEKTAINPGPGLKLAVFDITPVYTEFAEKIGVVKYYYNTGLMIRFVSSILEAADEYTKKTGTIVQVMLKSKRASKKGIHDHRYDDFLGTCEKEHENFKIVSFSENVFSFLDDCNLSISIPYTSVPYISAWLEKPAVFFDPSAELTFTNEPSRFVYTASGKKELNTIFEEYLHC